MADLSVTPASNYPASTDTLGSTDDYLRSISAIIRTTNAKGTDVPSATTTDIGSATGEFIDITGATTITSLGTVGAGIVRTVRFTGALTLTHNATSLILPGGVNITTANGDMAIFRSLGAGNWVCVSYSPISGNVPGVNELLTSVAGTNTVTGTAKQNVVAYTTGQQFTFIAANTNTGATTLNVNSIGAKNIYKNGTLPLDAGDITSGQAVSVVYDGTQFQIASGSGGSGAKAGGVIYENATTISSNYTLTTGKNGFSVGPITINTGVSVTVPSGARWVIA